MMTFGWRPTMSCYKPPVTAASNGLNTGQIAPAAANTTQQAVTPASGTPLMAAAMGIAPAASSCQSITWWYSLMAFAAIAGFASKGKA